MSLHSSHAFCYQAPVCAWCGEPYLHHDCVTVRFQHGRREMTSEVMRYHTSSEIDKDEQKAGEDDAVDVRCWCEQCDGYTLIRIEQHKGQTILWTERGGKRASGGWHDDA